MGRYRKVTTKGGRWPAKMTEQHRSRTQTSEPRTENGLVGRHIVQGLGSIFLRSKHFSYFHNVTYHMGTNITTVHIILLILIGLVVFADAEEKNIRLTQKIRMGNMILVLSMHKEEEEEEA
jgi:protein-S-isoprenylcysteine O-methyltransferase Ste14